MELFPYFLVQEQKVNYRSRNSGDAYMIWQFEALNIMVLENRLHMIHGDIKEMPKH